MKELIKIENNFKLSEIDQQIVDEINNLISKSKEIEDNEVKFKCNRNFRYNPTNHMTEVDIQNASINQLIDVTSFITAKSREYQNAAESVLGLAAYPEFNWMGFTYEQWIYDIQNAISGKDKESQKMAIKARLQDLISVLPEDVRKMQVLSKKPNF